jgi:hypothetical protein
MDWLLLNNTLYKIRLKQEVRDASEVLFSIAEQINSPLQLLRDINCQKEQILSMIDSRQLELEGFFLTT